MKSIKFILFLTILLLLGGCSKKPATIKGRVTDADGKALAGAAVFTIPQQQGVLTDSTGFYIIEEVPPGEYSILGKFGADSTVKLIGQVKPGEALTYDLVIFKEPPPELPPPPPPPVDTVKKVVETPPPAPKEPPQLKDPSLSSGVSVLHLGASDFIKKYEVESSDGLVWQLKSEKDSKLRFQGGRLFEGYFAGPYHKYWETAARKLEYDGRIWLYVHGPEKVVTGTRSISIGIPLGLPANAEIDSIVVEFGVPRFPADYTPGDVQLRMLGETASDIADLMEWKKVDHAENGLIRKQVIIPRGANRKLDKVTIEVDSDGDAVWDDLMIRPLVYFQLH